ncbi:nuclear mRNA export, poly(A)+RNA binding protein [Thecaphora frezii]
MQSKRGSRGGGHSIAGAALRNAGLMGDGDIGMRDAAGPSRSRGGNRAGRASGSAPASAQGAGQGAAGRQGKNTARQRANPLGGRPSGRKANLNVNEGMRSGNTAAVLGSVPNSKARGGGRIPGGGGLPFTSSEGPKSHNVVSVVKRFLESRWNAPAKFLNLENMKADPILAAENIKPPGVPGCPRELANVMWKICSEVYPDVVTISLANNDLSNLGPVNTLPSFLPKLQNLSLEGNELRWAKDLDAMANGKRGRFEALKELLLTGNPVYTNAVAAGNEEGYRLEILTRFPKLTLLDQKPVTPTESGFANLPRSSKSKKLDADAAQVPLRNFPVQNKPGFVDADASAIMPAFLSKFFSLYDTDRAALKDVYAPSAQFSYCVNVSPAPRAKAAGFLHTMPHQKELNFEKWNSLGGRNLMRVHMSKSRIVALHQGNARIIEMLNKLPRTTHPLTDASKFVFDAWVMPNNVIGASFNADEKPEAVLFVSVHGEFAEHPSTGVRSFDRAFIVAPVPPGSEAANAGWPCVILSDQMTIRHYSGTSAWALDALPTGEVGAPAPTAAAAPAGAAPAAAAATLPPHLQNQAPAPGLNEQQHTFSLQLAAQTGLSYPFAVQCLQENGWDPNVAMTNFQALKASNAIPPEAFASA